MTIDPTLVGLVTGVIGLALLLSVLVLRPLRARRRRAASAEAPVGIEDLMGDGTEVEAPADADAEVEVEVEVSAPDAEAPRRRHTFWALRRPRRTTSAGTSSEPVVQATTPDDVPSRPEPQPEPGPAPQVVESAALELVEVVDGELVEPDPLASGDESLVVRALRAQVRTLEQTLEDLRGVSDRSFVTDPADALAHQGPIGSYRHQVDLTLRALAARPLPGESAAHALARAIAAVERLDGGDHLTRPALPRTAGEPAAAPAGYVPAALAAAAPAVPAPPTVAAAVVAVEPLLVPVPAWTEPVTHELSEQRNETFASPASHHADEPAAHQVERLDHTASLDQVDQADHVDQVEVVLPVPPPMVVEPRRSRRWRRRHAAA